MKPLHDVADAPSAANAGAALERLFELVALLADGMERSLAERGLTRPRAELLWRLRERTAMTQRELSEGLGCTPRNVTDLVDALEGAGLVERRAHPTDRRATQVSLTRQGKTAVSRMRQEYESLAAGLFGDLSGAERATFIRVVDRALATMRQGIGDS